VPVVVPVPIITARVFFECRCEKRFATSNKS
jgi:hypothetical protein